MRVFAIPRFSGGAVSISVAFFCLFGFIFLITQYFQFVKGYSTLSAGVHTLPFAIVAAVATPVAAVVALRVGSRLVVTAGLLLMGAGLLVSAFNSSADTSYFGPIIVSMVLLALGLSSITAPTAEAVMGSVADDQRGAAAGVNNTTRELGGTLGVAVFGSIFASSYAPRIISAFRPLPIPAGPKAEAHQSMAAALAVVAHAPHAVRPALRIGRLLGLPQRARGGLHRRRRGRGAGCAGRLQAPARAAGSGEAFGRSDGERCAGGATPGRRAWARPGPTTPAGRAEPPSCADCAESMLRRLCRGSAGRPLALVDAKTSGACRTPAMTGLAVRSTAPAGASDAKRSSSSHSTTRRLEPGQRGPEAEVGPEPEAHVGVGVAIDRELAGVGAEDGLVPVGRRVDEQHRVARGDRLTPDGGGRRWPFA